MTDAPALGTGSCLQFNAPMSTQRADRLAAYLASRKPATILDLGCGWGELLLHALGATPGAHGVGIDTHGPDLARGRDNAATRGLADRVTFIEAPAAEHTDSADIILNIGAYQAFGTITDALRALHPLVNPGGRLLFATEIWQHPPTTEQLANMWPGMSVDDCTDLPGLVDQATAAGFRPLRIETATRGEWEEFESGFTAELEEWLLANPGHPEADTTRATADTHRAIWLRGHRDVMGFAYLTLGPEPHAG